MKYFVYISILVFTFSILSTAYAQEFQTITVGSDTVTYTDIFNDVPGATSYYKEEALIMTAYDEDGNGTPDVWVMYRDDRSVLREFRDSDGDGEPDILFDMDRDENLQRAGGEGMAKYSTSAPTSEEELDTASAVDYAGDLEDIEKLAGESGGVGKWVLIVVLVLGAYWWLKKK